MNSTNSKIVSTNSLQIKTFNQKEFPGALPGFLRNVIPAKTGI